MKNKISLHVKFLLYFNLRNFGHRVKIYRRPQASRIDEDS